MRIVLELLNGPEKGRKIRLGADQTITVGRTEWADFAVAGDQLLSSKHFALEANRQDCQLRDLGSANGTCLNGAPSQIATLKHGDRISAGESQFLVRIEADMTSLGATPNPVSEFRKAEAPVKKAAAVLPTPEITVQPARSELYEARCLCAQLPPLELAERLAGVHPLHLIVDFGRLGTPRPEALKQSSVLFNWLPGAAAAASPVVVSPCELPTARPLLEAGWGLDAIVCLFSSQSPDRLVSHVRAQARATHDCVMGYCWPSVLGPLLANSSKERASRLMEGVDLVLIEDRAEPEYWQVFSFSNLQMVFEKIGLRTAGPVESPSGG